ncbi:hypothetical protein SCLCIDRAFT_30847 [Scleroderma citrinum Foug A]|uniref:Uncharacterized protein n=1 Tax=Scleroderma citrinum Foug A TaxID=1036808 RepID=A0A0C2YYW6_9AGAM|nr:hypothetical protein SCLCIDRAFT_30847 [Scleroderma citrinum Foug A]
MGSLMPAEGRAPSYAQLYIYDPQVATDHRTRRNPQLQRPVLQELHDMLANHHPYVEIYKQAYQVMWEKPAEQHTDVCVQLHFNPGTDGRRYNLPTTDEIAAVILEMVQKQLMSIVKLCSACKVAVYKGSVTFIIPIQLYIMSCCFLEERRDGTLTSLFNQYVPPGQNLSPKFYTMLIVSILDLHKSNQAISFMVEGSFNNMFVMLGLLWNKASLLGSSITKRKFDLNSMVDCKIVSLKTLILISAILGAVLFYHHRIPEAHVICSSCCKTHLQSVVTVKSQICF